MTLWQFPHSRYKFAQQAVVCGLLLALCGCGASDAPELLPVEGTVTLDGQPLPGAWVIFEPHEPGQTTFSSSATTDAAGHYVLRYNARRHGAVPGQYRVRIGTEQPERDGPDGKVLPAVPERLPARYHRDTELVVEVSPENQTLDFALSGQ